MLKSKILGTVADYRNNLFYKARELGAVTVTVDFFENSELFIASDANGNRVLSVTLWTSENAYTIHERINS